MPIAAFSTLVRLPNLPSPSPRHRPQHLTRRQPAMSDHPLFAVRCIDKPNSKSLRAENRPAHLEWASDPSNHILFAGPLARGPEADVHGSLVIMRAPTAEAVHQALAQDPYNNANLFEHVNTRQWVMGMASDQLPDNLFLVWCDDKPQSLQLRKETRPAHLEWWKAAGRRGIIGPFPCQGGANGTLIVCEGQTVAEVSEWAATDPYNHAGLFQSVDVCAVRNVVDRVSISKINS